MIRYAYVNGRYARRPDAVVDIEDRGYQFADGVYEVVLMIDGALWDLDEHLTRLERSFRELSMAAPMSRAALALVMRETARRNHLRNALIYLQVTRGVAPRNHAFPAPETPPALVVTARPFNLSASDAQAAKGVSVITTADIRWRRVDIKSVSLLPNALAKQAAHEAGAAEAWLLRDGVVTEGSSSNAWIVTHEGTIITHPKTNDILGGVTRERALGCARALGMNVEQRAFSLDEAKGASEAFISSATSLVMPVIAIDGAAIGDGAPGAVAQKLRQSYKDSAPQPASPMRGE